MIKDIDIEVIKRDAIKAIKEQMGVYYQPEPIQKFEEMYPEYKYFDRDNTINLINEFSNKLHTSNLICFNSIIIISLILSITCVWGHYDTLGTVVMTIGVVGTVCFFVLPFFAGDGNMQEEITKMQKQVENYDILKRKYDNNFSKCCNQDERVYL